MAEKCKEFFSSTRNGVALPSSLIPKLVTYVTVDAPVDDVSELLVEPALEDAYEISKGMDEPDLELDLDGLGEPKWGHHSFRRAADRFAQLSMEVTGVSKDLIDEFFGWKQALRAKDMQMHYAGRQERARRAKVTMMI